MTTAAATPQINDLIGWIRKNNRAARSLAQFFEVVCLTKTENFHIWGSLKTTRARSSKSFILCLHLKTIPAKQAEVHLPFFFYNVEWSQNT